MYQRSWTTSLELRNLQPSTTYYIKVRVITADGSNLSPYSSAVPIATRAASDYPYLSPTGLKAESLAADSAVVRWLDQGSSPGYRVEYASTPKSPKYVRFYNATSGKLTNLTAETTYAARVRVISGTGVNLSEYSPRISFTTKSAALPVVTSFGLRVASYNVKCANCFSGLPNENTWSVRAPVVAKTIRDQAPDVIGVQEASQGWLRDASGNQVNLSQFEDLIQRLGNPYRLTNSARNNCVKSTTPSNCVPADQGASLGTKIIYNSNRVSLLSQGSRLLTSLSGKERYFAWAIFQDKVTSKKFFFGDTHLEPGSTGYPVRKAQTRDILAEIERRNPGHLPVIMVGDFNSHKWTTPDNTPYDLMLGAGYVDPLGNYYHSTTSTRGATVESRIRTNYSSFNDFVRVAKKFSYINGTYLDYVFTTPMRVQEWETVVDVDAEGQFVGVIPSDHNMVRATVLLP